LHRLPIAASFLLVVLICGSADAYTQSKLHYRWRWMYRHYVNAARDTSFGMKRYVIMRSPVYERSMKLLLLESWLPLAQELNMFYEWDCDAQTLEALILHAAPALAQSHTALEARVILWHYHVKNQQRKEDER
jgi:hypothetical protein